MRRFTASVLLGAALVAGLACRSTEGDDGDTEAVEELPPFEPDAPRLLDPASDDVEIPITRVVELEFGVADVVSGFTTVVLDGQSLGPLQEGSVIGELGRETLRLRTGGAMAPGEHTLVLRTQGAEEVLESREVLLRLTPSAPATLTAELDDAPAFEADVVFSTGADAATLLVGMNASPDAEAALHVVPVGEGPSWDITGALDVPLPLRTEDEELALTVAVARVVAAELSPDDDRLRVAWRARPGADQILLVDTLWNTPAFAPRAALELSTDLLGNAEAGILGRPLLVGDTLVVEALLATDVEQPRPGDRVLITTHLDGTPSEAGTPRVSQLSVGADMDRLGEVVDLQGVAVGANPRFSARVAGVTPAVVSADHGSGALSLGPSLANDVVSALGGLEHPPVTLLSSFSTRTLFASVGNDPLRALVLQFDDRRAAGRRDIAPSAASLDGLPEPTGPAVGTVIAGAPVFLLPLGSNDDAVAFVVNGESTDIKRIAGLTCDALALSHTTVGNASGVAAIACHRGREVFVGRLNATES